MRKSIYRFTAVQDKTAYYGKVFHLDSKKDKDVIDYKAPFGRLTKEEALNDAVLWLKANQLDGVFVL